MMDFIAYFVFALVYLAIVVLMLYKHYHGKREKDYLDFFCVFTASFSLYALVGTFDRVIEHSANIYTSMIVYLSIIVGYFFAAMGYFRVSGRYANYSFETNGNLRFQPQEILPFSTRVSINYFLFISLTILFIAINYDRVANMILNFGTGASYIETSARGPRTAFSGAKSLFSSFFTLFFLGFPFVRIYRSGKIRVLDLVIFIIQGAYSLASGHRNTLLIMGIMILALYNYKVRHIKLGRLCIIGFIAMTAFVSLGHLRASNSISGMIERMMNSSSGIFMVTSTGEFYNTVGTFYSYVDAIHTGSHAFNFGYTYIVDILIFIPTFLFPGRPLPWSEQYMLDFYPDAPTGSGHGWYLLNDGYMSFGIIGIAVELYILGCFMAKLYYFLRERMESEYIGYMYCVILSFVFLLSRGSFLGLIKTGFLEISPLIVIYNIDNLCKGKLRWRENI